MTSSFYETLGRGTDAPPDISKTNYLAVEADMSEAVNKNIDKISDSWNAHFDQMIEMYNHMHNNRKGPKELLELAADKKTIAAANSLKDWNDWAKTYYPKSRQLQTDVRNLQKSLANGIITKAEYDEGIKEAGYDTDKDIKNEVDLENNKSALKTAGNNLALEDLDKASKETSEINIIEVDSMVETLRGPLGIHYKDTEINENLDQLLNQLPEWQKRAQVSLKMFVGNYTPDGQPLYQKYDDLSSLEDKKRGMEIINAWYVYNHEDVVEGRLGLYKRKFITKLLTLESTRELADYKDHIKAAVDIHKEEMGKELNTKLKTEGASYAIQWIKENVGNPEFLDTNGIPSHKLARDKLLELIIEGINNNTIEPDVARSILKHEFEAHDNTMQVVEDYWPDFAKKINTALNKAATEEADAAKEQKETAEIEYINKIVKAAKESDEVYTWQQKANVIKEFRQMFGYLPTSQFPDHVKPLLDLQYQGMKEDIGLAADIAYRSGVLDQRITKSDLVGITDPGLKSTLNETYVKPGLGFDAKGSASKPGTIANRDSRVKTIVNTYTNETLEGTEKSLKWLNNYDNAIRFYGTKFNEAKESGMSDWNAAKVAEDATLDRIKDTIPFNKGTEKDPRWVEIGVWDKKGYMNHDREALLGRNKLIKAINKDRALVNQESPFEGEEKHIEAAAKYFKQEKNKEKGLVIPEYYRYLGTKLNINPRKLMKTRLIANGILKDGDIVIPEENIPGAEILLTKPTVNKVLRVFNQNPDTTELLNLSKSPEAIDNGGYSAIKHQDKNIYENIENVLNKPLDEITLGDVYYLSEQGYNNLGMYDMTASGFRDIVDKTGMPLDVPWNQAGQDLFYLARLKQKSQNLQKNTGVVTEYRRLVNIEPDLHNKFKELAGDLPPWLALDTLQSEVAKELVKSLIEQ